MPQKEKELKLYLTELQEDLKSIDDSVERRDRWGITFTSQRDLNNKVVKVLKILIDENKKLKKKINKMEGMKI